MTVPVDGQFGAGAYGDGLYGGGPYNFGAFVDNRNVQRKQWDPSGVKPVLIPEPRR